VPPKKKAVDRNGQLEAAVAVLINNQAHFLAVAARIETEFVEIKNILIRHEQMLSGLHGIAEAIKDLPEAIREKIGFASRK